MKSRAVALALALCAPGVGCAPESAQPVTEDVEVIGSMDAPEAQLRAALVWVIGSPTRDYVTSFDRRLDDPTKFRMSLRLPSPDELRETNPISNVKLTELTNTDVHHPRIVLYDDVNDSGDLDFDFGLSDAGTSNRVAGDRILGLSSYDHPHPGAIADLKHVLRQMNLSETAEFYELTDGRFTPFIGMGSRAATQRLSELTVPLLFGAPVTLAANLWCQRSSQSALTGVTSSRVVVDSTLDRTAACGASLTACESVNLSAADPPELESLADGSVVRRSECRRNGDLEWLLIREQETTCSGCTCISSVEVLVHVASRQKLPNWWPCGDEIPVCASGAPITILTPNCGELDEGTADAGSR